MKEYAGIGSRNTPQSIQKMIMAIAARLAQDDWILRSGHSPGADQAFEKAAGKKAQLYLPWKNFENKVEKVADFIQEKPDKDAFSIAQKFHPHWNSLGHGGQRLLARNTHQILGRDLNSPCKFVVCWTADGSLDGKSSKSGGTGQSLRVADAFGIKTFNLGFYDHLKLLEEWLD